MLIGAGVDWARASAAGRPMAAAPTQKCSFLFMIRSIWNAGDGRNPSQQEPARRSRERYQASQRRPSSVRCSVEAAQARPK
jgi:hypothetical protein